MILIGGEQLPTKTKVYPMILHFIEFIKITYDEAVALHNHVKNTSGDILELGRLWGGTTRISHAAETET